MSEPSISYCKTNKKKLTTTYTFNRANQKQLEKCNNRSVGMTLLIVYIYIHEHAVRARQLASVAQLVKALHGNRSGPQVGFLGEGL